MVDPSIVPALAIKVLGNDVKESEKQIIQYKAETKAQTGEWKVGVVKGAHSNISGWNECNLHVCIHMHMHTHVHPHTTLKGSTQINGLVPLKYVIN